MWEKKKQSRKWNIASFGWQALGQSVLFKELQILNIYMMTTIQTGSNTL